MTVGLGEGGCIEGFRRVKFGEVGGGMNASGGRKVGAGGEARPQAEREWSHHALNMASIATVLMNFNMFS